MGFDRNFFRSAEELADTTDARPFGQWFNGVGLAAVVAVYAVDCLVTQSVSLPYRRTGGVTQYQEYLGLPATALGCLALSIALFMHLHFFWTASPRFWGYAQLGKLIAAAGMIGSVALFYCAVLLQS